jgi:hypothetical protein
VSAKSGTLCKTVTPSAKTTADMMANAAFLLPATSTHPASRFPPEITSASILF